METMILKPTAGNIESAAAEIRRGGLVAFPTETVYGLGANALNRDAVLKIFEAKGRPSDNPLIVHLSGADKIGEIAYWDPRAEPLIKRFMPGALTLVFNKKKNIPYEVTGGLDTVGVRIPDNSVALELLSKSGVPIAAPSANTSQKPSPTTAEHVFDDLAGKLKYILDGGSCRIGIESTILDFSSAIPRLLRRGGIPLEQLERILGRIEVAEHSEKALCPGMKYRHYAPKAEVHLVPYGDTGGLCALARRCIAEGKKCAVLCLSSCAPASDASDVILMKNADEYANRLFCEFRNADANSATVIICEKAPETGIGASLNNRLEKACGAKR